MFWRALLAFILLPGMVAFLGPVLLLTSTGHLVVVYAGGLIVLVLGIGLLLLCVRDFYVAGKGTLAPWEPPKHLVVTGVYRYSRNPMYCAVALILAGWTITFASNELLIYTLVVIGVVYMRVVYGEEPRLARSFGGEWDQYKQQVRRWV
ncbi:MAG: methyltransferase [Anaerolineae bacterium]